ncbi:MAG TPA: sensor histidine kinase [Novosphingobium sp.]|nr:sensor histidine kinase [Novosphingobium sp.]
MTGDGPVLARATSDEQDRLVSADEPLAGLQRRCGGDLPGTIAIPALLEVVRKARRYDLRLARTITARDGEDAVKAWLEIAPRGDGGLGCEILVRSWQTSPEPPESAAVLEARKAEIDRALAELTARLDTAGAVLTVEADAPDLAGVATAMRGAAGRHWSSFFRAAGGGPVHVLHWRLMDGAMIEAPGSDRAWRVHLFPQGLPGAPPQGFELCLTSDAPSPRMEPTADPAPAAGTGGLVGRGIAPVLRQPIARIIANAETIRTRLAGPLADEYASYAADIAAAGEHLLGLLDDLADLEVVEAEDFATAPDHIDLADVARRAAGILGVRARERGIVIDAPKDGESLPAVAEFRRVLQILLNLIGNAIRYGPASSQVWIRLEEQGARARVIVADQGPGLTAEQQARVFDKFERLGRGNDGGSGLGLYISRRLARAMGGELSVESAPGQGARFILDLPGEAAASA